MTMLKKKCSPISSNIILSAGSVRYHQKAKVRKVICRACDIKVFVNVVWKNVTEESKKHLKEKGWILNLDNLKNSLCPNCNMFKGKIGE